jgi:hypothetical protein
MEKLRQIPVRRDTVDMETGEPIKRETSNFQLMPPPKDACQVCATKHEPHLPHNAQSMYYQYAFYGAVGRWPTWVDAAAHCDEAMRELWRKGIAEHGAKWTEPPEGWPPVSHLGEPHPTSDPTGFAAFPAMGDNPLQRAENTD